MIQDQNILNHPSILLSFHIVFSQSFSATFSVFFLVSGVLVPATGLVPQGWRKQERKRKARLVKQKLEKEKAKKYRAWVRRTRAEEKEKEKKKEQDQEKEKVRKKGMGASGSCGSWFIWLVFFLLPVQVEAHTLFGTCLAGLWAFLPLGILTFMAPKKKQGHHRKRKGAGRGTEDQEEEQQQEMGEGEVLEEEELPEKNLTREEPN